MHFWCKFPAYTLKNRRTMRWRDPTTWRGMDKEADEQG
jgi:hypothetical protein